MSGSGLDGRGGPWMGPGFRRSKPVGHRGRAWAVGALARPRPLWPPYFRAVLWRARATQPAAETSSYSGA